MGLGSKLRTVHGLGPAVHRVGLIALPTLTAIGLALRTVGYARTCRWLDRVAAPGQPTLGRRLPGQPMPSQTVATGLLLAARILPWRPACLERSLALCYLLRRRGHPAEVRIGVRKRGGGAATGSAMATSAIDLVATDLGAIEAHAWVEVNGEVVGDRPDVHQRFLPFDEAQAPLAGGFSRLHR